MKGLSVVCLLEWLSIVHSYKVSKYNVVPINFAQFI